MSKRLSWMVLTGLVLVAASAGASQRYDDSETDRFSLRLGSFSLQDSNTVIRVDSADGVLGTVINFEETLDVESRTDVARLDGYYRFNPRHRIDFSYFDIERDGSATLLDDIDFDDETFLAGARVDTVYNTEIFKVSYSYSFIHVEQYEFGVGIGLHTTNLEASLDVPDIGQKEDAEGTAPLPVFNFRGRFNFTPKWSAQFKFEWFILEFDEYEGSFTDSLLTIEHQTFKNVGFGIGVNRLNLEVEATADDLRGEVESGNSGAVIFAKVGW